MVRGGSGRFVAATVALLEKQQTKQQTSDNNNKDSVESSMDDSTLKCNSSTDSGKDDQSLITSTSSTSSNSNEDLGSICCKNDFQWVLRKEENVQDKIKAERGRERKQPEVRMRKPSVSLDRKRVSRRERDHKSRSTATPKYHDCCSHDYRAYCDYGDRLSAPMHDYRIPYFYRPPPLMPCDYPYRFVTKPTNELQEQLRRFESDKETLSLQVAVLTDQVEAQAEKIADLERTISEQKRQISASEDLLQREMLTRSSLETQKLELLAVVSEMKRHESALEKDNIDLRDRLAEEKRKNKPPLAPRNHLYPSTSTPTNFSEPRISPSPSPLSTHSRKLDYSDSSHNTPTSQKVLIGGQYRSLPREHQGESTALRRAVVFGRPTDHPRCSSVPNLAETETIVIDREKDGEQYTKESSPTMQSGQPKGIRKIFGKMKRSGSGSLDDIPSEEQFTRGGVRSTAGPRLCGNTQGVKNDKPFSEWTTDEICAWFKEMGLENSLQDARRWVKTGQVLLSATPQEIDKELNIKNPLLRKKLHLALEAERGVASDPYLECAGRLEPGWVLRWLDDIGLPQYKASFLSARLDGRVLHRLSMDDIQGLHINLSLHLASVRTGIQVLRKEKFDPHCLIRRSDPENETDERVELWTNHRVMEWLRLVDLAEYAPNLRGSGVHGGLMIHEDRFTDTLLASLLSIPSEKTLLRRHLSTHFKQLLGPENIQKKREAEATLGYVPLTINLKIKVAKKSQFTLKRKKSKYDVDEGELVCPLNDSRGCQSTTGDSSPDIGQCLELNRGPTHRKLENWMPQ
ncbi:liprin-beta-1 isoform X4 [Cimex lectularius]|uniref:SAM domain-containing protein n=1 Tax=Cimex lectularius TaxID=79782 RepID=A0A8I6S2H8_CIMLE|nr:liprin-beta-1 isoform X4 [Cimex lectularius]